MAKLTLEGRSWTGAGAAARRVTRLCAPSGDPAAAEDLAGEILPPADAVALHPEPGQRWPTGASEGTG